MPLRDYPQVLVMPLPGVGRLVVFSAFPSPGVVHPEIAGRELFLFDEADRAVWQISPEQGTTEGRQHAFDRAIATDEPFVNVWRAGGDLYASRFNGDTFRVDPETGAAIYSGWART